MSRTDLRPGEHCPACNLRTMHLTTCPGAFTDERTVVCRACDEEFAQSEGSAGHRCPEMVREEQLLASPVLWARGEVNGPMMAVLQDGSVKERVQEGGKLVWRDSVIPGTPAAVAGPQ